MKLRDYQQTAVDSSIAELKATNSTLLVMATGLGKTVVFADIIRRIVQSGRGDRVLVLAHREELIYQASASISRIAGCEAQIEMGDLRSTETIWSRSPVVVSSIQTQVAGRGKQRRMHKFDPTQFSLIVVDEAHHATSDSYQAVLDYYRNGNPNIKILGVTATPDRSDGTALGSVFGSVSCDYGIRKGIEDGWLVGIHQRMVSVGSLDLSSCKTSSGDLNINDLDRIVQYEEVLHGMVYPTIQIVGDRRCVIFASSVAHAKRIAEIINRHKNSSAVCVDANTPRETRKDIFRAFASGNHQFLVNVGIITEGWDDPASDGKGVQCIAVMRPTKSRSLYSQMIGRGTRTLPSTIKETDTTATDRVLSIKNSHKPFLEVIDFCGNAGKHKLIHCVDALTEGKSPSESHARAKRIIAENGEAQDVLAVMTEAERIVLAESEALARKSLVLKASYSSQTVDPFGMDDIAPNRSVGWGRGKPASDKQLNFLRRLKIEHAINITAGEAGRLIGIGTSTPSAKQMAMLRSRGINPSGLDRRSASEAIDKAMKGWTR